VAMVTRGNLSPTTSPDLAYISLGRRRPRRDFGDKRRLCFALALWTEYDAILQEQMFGLTNNEGTHGDDVKEYQFYVDTLRRTRT